MKGAQVVRRISVGRMCRRGPRSHRRRTRKARSEARQTRKPLRCTRQTRTRAKGFPDEPPPSPCPRSPRSRCANGSKNLRRIGIPGDKDDKELNGAYRLARRECAKELREVINDPGETIAAVLPFVCLVAALFRARIVALALAPSCIGIIAGIGFGVDTSSASHPIRWIVPIATLALAGFATWWLHVAAKVLPLAVGKRRLGNVWAHRLALNPRALVASSSSRVHGARPSRVASIVLGAYAGMAARASSDRVMRNNLGAALGAGKDGLEMAPINRSPFATVAMLMAVGAGFTMAPPPPAVERISPPEPWSGPIGSRRRCPIRTAAP